MIDQYQLNEFVTESIVDSESELIKLKEARIVITGASGFIGSWISSLLYVANLELSLNMNLFFLVGKSNELLLNKTEGKVKWKSINFEKNHFDLNFNYTHAIHCSTPSNVHSGSQNSTSANAVATNSLRSLLVDAKNSKIVPKLMHLSSGSVYEGSHDYKNISVSEFTAIKSETSRNSYDETKISLEEEINNAAARGLIVGSSPRLFAFYGPRLALDAHFAIGNFMQNAINREPIKIQGNPNTIRSYMYPTDLLNFLVRILVDPESGSLNIGSSKPRTLYETARSIGDVFGISRIETSANKNELTSYFPSTEKVEERYDYCEKMVFETGIEKWRRWLEVKPRS